MCHSSVIFILEIWKVYCVRMDVYSNGPRQRWQMVWLTAAFGHESLHHIHQQDGKDSIPPVKIHLCRTEDGQTSHFSTFFQNKIHNPDYCFTFLERYKLLFIWMSVRWLFRVLIKVLKKHTILSTIKDYICYVWQNIIIKLYKTCTAYIYWFLFYLLFISFFSPC